MINIKEEEIVTLYGEEVLVGLEEKGYSILPTKEISDEDKKQRKGLSVSFIVKTPNSVYEQ